MNLYALLELEPSASAEDIERAYRRLARRHHPGVNPGDRVSEERYRHVREAYAVLADPLRRRDYDRGGAAAVETAFEATVSLEGFDFTAPAQGAGAATFSELFADVFHDAARRAAAPARGHDVELGLRVSFEDAMRGGTFPLSVVRQQRCPACGGSARAPQPPAACEACDGQGQLRWARGHMVFTRTCEACAGRGQVVTQPCRSCSGAGVQPRSEVVTVALPPGIEQGARLAIPGRGHAGADSGAAGDLYVVLEVSPHRFFRRDGRDLHLALPVAVHEAGLGARVEVPTLNGIVRLRVPPGATSGQRLRLRGRGVPAAHPDAEAGDLIVELQIVLLPVRDERSKALLREFGQLNSEDVRRHLFA